MKLVIEIDEEDKKEIDERLKDKGIAFWEHAELIKSVLLAVFHGTPLPKGHGRLIDADAVLVEPFGNTYKDIDTAETIIEADNLSDKYVLKAVTRGNCMLCGKELTEGIFFCKECEKKGESVKK